MDIIRRFIDRLNCNRGNHVGGNFCIHCGVALRDDCFFLYRLTSNDGTLDVLVRAINGHHAKRAFLGQYRQVDLVAQRVPDDAA